MGQVACIQGRPVTVPQGRQADGVDAILLTQEGLSALQATNLALHGGAALPTIQFHGGNDLAVQTDQVRPTCKTIVGQAVLFQGLLNVIHAVGSLKAHVQMPQASCPISWVAGFVIGNLAVIARPLLVVQAKLVIVARLVPQFARFLLAPLRVGVFLVCFFTKAHCSLTKL